MMFKSLNKPASPRDILVFWLLSLAMTAFALYRMPTTLENVVPILGIFILLTGFALGVYKHNRSQRRKLYQWRKARIVLADDADD